MTSMLTHARLLATLVALCLTTAATPATAAVKDDWAFSEAVEQYQRGHWADTYGRFIELANDGDRDAARIALFMYRYGPRLYGSYWDASPDELDVWERLGTQGPKTFRAAPVFKPKYH